MLIDPSCRGLAYSLRRYFVDRFYDHEVGKLPKGSYILDIGGNKTGKRGVFNIEVFEHRVVYLNLSPQKFPDIVADAAALPFGNNVFDAVICSELFEHIYNFQDVLAETLRVLKPNGVMLATVPFMYPQHPDPNDYFRYTKQFFLLQLDSLGFTSISAEQQGGFWCVFADMARAIVCEWHGRAEAKKLTPFLAPLRLLSDWFKSRALQWDSNPQTLRTVYCKGVTTGFGVKAYKPLCGIFLRKV